MLAHLRVLVVLVVAAMATAAAQGEIHEATFTIDGFSFAGPAELPAGMTTITLANTEERDELVTLVRLAGGRTLDDFFGAMMQLFAGEVSVVPEWIEFYGGLGMGGGETRSYTIFLGPGTYYLVSLEADDEGPYAARGLVHAVEFVAPAVDADVTVTLQDYEFVIDGAFTSGRQTVRVHNAANQPHEMLIFPLPPGVSVEELFAGPPEGAEHGEHDGEAGEEPEIPASAVQGVFIINPGETAYVDVPLEAGRYVLVCFVPDADGPHAMQGMYQEIEVE